MPSHGKGGRKPEREEVKRAQIPVRTTPKIKARLEAAAKESGRSLTQEIEARLEASLAEDRAEQTPETRRLLATIAEDIERAEKATGNRWHKNLVTWAWVREAMASGEIERRCPENDRLLSDVDGIVAEQREELVELSLKLEYDVETLKQLGLELELVPNTIASMIQPYTALRYNYEATEAAWDKADIDEGLKKAGRFMLGRIRATDEQRVATGKLYEANIGQFVKATVEGVRLWEEDLASRGVIITREFRPSATVRPTRLNVPGGLFGAGAPRGTEGQLPSFTPTE